jgi:arylsulfatase A-like enzyme
VPDTAQGRSAVPLLRDRQAEWPDDVFVQVSEAETARAVRTHRWKYGITAPDADLAADPGSSEYIEAYLFDLRADPWELDNRIGLESHRAVADRLQERLLADMARAGEDLPVIRPAEPRPGKQRRVLDSEIDA